MDFEALLADEAVRGKLIATLACVIAVLVVRAVLARLIRGLRWNQDADRLAWLSRIRWMALIALVCSLRQSVTHSFVRSLVSLVGHFR